jgi:hypothetical protein
MAVAASVSTTAAAINTALDLLGRHHPLTMAIE